MKKLLKKSGFTLLEILVALLILAIISAILVSGLRSVVNTKDRISNVSDRLAQAQIAMTIISADFRQVINRPIYDNDGQILSAVLLHSSPDQELEFTRDGYINPMNQEQRSTLERVSYRLQNGNLERGAWPVLDRSANSQANYQIILSNVEQIQWRFMGPNNTIFPSWPSPQVSAAFPIPKAIELSITIHNWGTIHRWVVVESYQASFEKI